MQGRHNRNKRWLIVKDYHDHDNDGENHDLDDYADNHRNDLKMLIWWLFHRPGRPDERVEGQGPQAQWEQVGNDDYRDHDLASDYDMLMIIMIDLMMIEWEQDTGRLMILWWWADAQLKVSAIIYICCLL